MTRPKNPASIVSRKRSRWNSGASVDATVTQEKRTMLNGQRRPNHQTFFLQTPTRSGSTRGRAVSLIAMLFLSAYLGGYRSCLCLVRPLQTEKRYVRVDPNTTMENVLDQDSYMHAEKSQSLQYTAYASSRTLIAKIAHFQP